MAWRRNTWSKSSDGLAATTLTKVSWLNYEHSKPASKGLRETLLLKFFRRVWIVQGVIVSDTVGAVCGKECLSLCTLTIMMAIPLSHNLDIPSVSHAPLSPTLLNTGINTTQDTTCVFAIGFRFIP